MEQLQDTLQINTILQSARTIPILSYLKHLDLAFAFHVSPGKRR